MTSLAEQPCTAFAGAEKIAAGPLKLIARTLVERPSRPSESVLIFDDETGRQIDIDLSGTTAQIIERLNQRSTDGTITDTPSGEPRRGPGRPKLGVVSREVTLLPRHWDWLNTQPGGASVALRKLVEDARKLHAGRDRTRSAQAAAYAFMSACAGNLPNFEEAIRALFANNHERFADQIATWPKDLRAYAFKLAAIPEPMKENA